MLEGLRRWVRGVFGMDQVLFIDPRRINDEERSERRRALEDNAGYRSRVKRRMLEGLTMEQLPPLYNRPAVLAEKERRKVLPLKRK